MERMDSSIYNAPLTGATGECLKNHPRKMTYCVPSELSKRFIRRTLVGAFCWLLVVLSGCRGTGAKGGQARYWACSREEPPMAQSGSSGSTAFNLQKRTLTLKPGAANVRLAIFSGSELQSPSSDMLAYLSQTQADVFIVLGGLGRTDGQALATANALSTLQRLVLVVRGGSDGFEQKLANVPNLLDASALRSIRIGQDNLLLWPGSEQTRYVVGPASCGWGEPELTAAQDELGAPEPGGPLAAFAARVAAQGVLYAWPPTAEGAALAWNPAQPQLVPRAWGPRMEASDGQAMERGALVLSFDREGPHSAR
jgi:hypothetical protein